MLLEEIASRVAEEMKQDCDQGLLKWPLGQMVAAYRLDAAPENQAERQPLLRVAIVGQPQPRFSQVRVLRTASVLRKSTCPRNCQRVYFSSSIDV